MLDPQEIRAKALELAIKYKKTASAGNTDVLVIAKIYAKYIKDGE